ncbi:hypothetical protein LLH00_18610 [bacterium]|nr:hypothetical protein [bacterium]
MRRLLVTMTFLALLGSVPGFTARVELPLLPAGGAESFTPWRLAVGGSGEVFVLDREHARLHKFSPRDGREMWRTDGTESGEAFIDPSFLSRPDGFYLYLTDRGNRKVWRIDYRGEIRGSLDLPFATDPIFFDLAAGRQFVVYDRASGLVHLLDDSGRSLFSFPPGGPEVAAEPLDMALDAEGKQVFFLWPGSGGISSNSLSGQKGLALALSGEHAEPVRLSLCYGAPLILTRDGRRYVVGPSASGWMSNADTTDTDLRDNLRDILNVPGAGFYSLMDNPPRLVIDTKERPD